MQEIVIMATAAGWAGVAVNATLAVFSALLFRPHGRGRDPAPISFNLAWAMLTVGAVFNVIGFTAEALKFGRFPEVDYATNWVRYTRQGLAMTAFFASLTALALGGVEHYFFTIAPVLGYGALSVFAALSFETNEAVIAFFVFAIVAWSWSWMSYWWWNAGTHTLMRWIPATTYMIEAGFLAMVGIENLKRNTASNEIEDWVFFGFTVLNAMWFGSIYWMSTMPNEKTRSGGTTLSRMFASRETYNTMTM